MSFPILWMQMVSTTSDYPTSIDYVYPLTTNLASPYNLKLIPQRNPSACLAATCPLYPWKVLKRRVLILFSQRIKKRLDLVRSKICVMHTPLTIPKAPENQCSELPIFSIFAASDKSDSQGRR